MGLLDFLANRVGYTKKPQTDGEFKYPSTMAEIENAGFKFLKETDVLAERTARIRAQIDEISEDFLLAEEQGDQVAMKLAINLFYNLCATTIIPWLRTVNNKFLMRKTKLFLFKYNLNHDVPSAYNKLVIYAKYLLGFFSEVDVTIPRPVIIHSMANQQQGFGRPISGTSGGRRSEEDTVKLPRSPARSERMSSRVE